MEENIRNVLAYPTIGTFEGECADSNITNENGLDITRPVWEMVFSSEEYKKALRLGWYIGFLGHPDDPGCMDFEHACIVMTEGHIAPNGKVYGKFNLVDTPVGRIVKAFIDAGVVFGISVRGAGDIFNNSVDPESFIFRGFDLVTFPAFPESIPAFTEIAASTDINVRKRYKAVCAAIRANVSNITSSNTISVIQSQFAPQSAEYKILESRKSSLNASSEDQILAQKLDAMTHMYIQTSEELKKITNQLEQEKLKCSEIDSASRRRIAAIERITASQAKKADRKLHRLSLKYKSSIKANNILKDEVIRTSDRLNMIEQQKKEARKVVSSIDTDSKLLTQENLALTAKNTQLQEEVDSLKSKISILNSQNLKYRKKIQAANSDIDRMHRANSNIQKDFDETVNENNLVMNRASNLEAENSRLQNQLSAAQELCREYQKAYSMLYGSAVGVDIDSVPITANMSVSEMKSAINSSSNLIHSQESFSDVTLFDFLEDDSSLITM